MCRLAVAGDPFFAVEDLELARPGPSYTIDTARELRRRGWERVDWLIGADMLAGLHTWHRAEELLQEVTFVVMTRPGHPVESADIPGAVGTKARVHVVEVPQVDISSTLIRQRVSAGLPIRYLAPDAVCEYIAAHRLYR
jgi:nicotinate-nucleotide adenylyltransferase